MEMLQGKFDRINPSRTFAINGSNDRTLQAEVSLGFLPSILPMFSGELLGEINI